MWDLLGQLCNVESLHLYSETVGVKDFMIKFLWFSIQKKYCFCDYYVVMQCLRSASEFDPPMFHKLSFLNFGVDDHLNYVLPLLLHRTPNLEVLVFDMVC